MNVGIYRIRNEITGKVYIGQSVNVTKRLNAHKNSLRLGNHRNVHLQSSWKEYGEDSFSFEVIVICAVEELDDLERLYIRTYASDNPEFGYNFTSGGNTNHAHTIQSRIRMSESHKGKVSPRKGTKMTPEQIERNRKSHIGIAHSKESKRKLSLALKGRKGISRPITEETKKKISIALTGRVQSDETREKISNSRRGYKPTQATKDKISAILKGRTQSPDLIERRAEALRGKKRKNSSSKFIGVCWKARDKVWKSSIFYNRTQIIIGWFKDEVAAARAYNIKAVELYGDSAKLNIIDGDV